MNIVCFEIEEWEALALQAAIKTPCTMTKDLLQEGNAAAYASAEIVSCFIRSTLNKAVLAKLPKLRMIATRSTGVDHIDLEYCNERGITVANVPGYGESTVAEHVFALLLALSRHIPLAVRKTRDGDFSFEGLQGFDLNGRTIGIIGTGAIGRHTAQIAKGFGMRVLAHDIHPLPDTGLEYVALEQLLAESDVISLHVPGTPQTHHMLSDREFGLMKNGVVIINTARGAVIDVKALLRALQSGKVGGAGLDVLPDEPAIREEAELLHAAFAERHDLETLLIDHALLHHRNVIVTPHSGFYTREALERILRTTAGNIAAFIAGGRANVVNNPRSSS